MAIEEIWVPSTMCLIPQDLDYPGLELNINREQAGLLGISPRECSHWITLPLRPATSNGQIAPSYWIGPKTGNNYMLTVQYPLKQDSNDDRPSRQIPCVHPAIHEHDSHCNRSQMSKDIDTPAKSTIISHAPRSVDIYVMPKTEKTSAGSTVRSGENR